jgi:tetratricopeptide (TPR) repeat protein
MKTGTANCARKWTALVFCALAIAAATAAAAPSPAAPGGEPQPAAKAPTEEASIPADFEKQIADAREAALSSTKAQNEGTPLMSIYSLCQKYKQSKRGVTEFRALIPQLDKKDPPSGSMARVLLVASLVDCGELEAGMHEVEVWKAAIKSGGLPDIEGQVRKAAGMVAKAYERDGKWQQAMKLWQQMIAARQLEPADLETAAHLADCFSHLGYDQKALALISRLEKLQSHLESQPGGPDSPDIGPSRALATVVKAEILAKEGKHDEAVEVCSGIIGTMGDTERNTELAQSTKRALRLIASLQNGNDTGTTPQAPAKAEPAGPQGLDNRLAEVREAAMNIPADFEQQIAEARRAALTDKDPEHEGFPLLAIYGLCMQTKQPMRAVQEFRALIPQLDKTAPYYGASARLMLVASLVDAGKLEDASHEIDAWRQSAKPGETGCSCGDEVEYDLRGATGFVAMGYERSGNWKQALKLWEPMSNSDCVPGQHLQSAAHLADCLEHLDDAKRSLAVISQMEEWAARNPIGDPAECSHLAYAEIVKARIFVKEGKFAEAVAICESVKTDPKYAGLPGAEPQNEPVPVVWEGLSSSQWIKEAEKMLSAMPKETGVSKAGDEEKPAVSPVTGPAPVEVPSADPIAALGAALVARAQVGKVEITFNKATVGPKMTLFFGNSTEQKYAVTNPVRIRWLVTGILASLGNGPARESGTNAEIALFFGNSVVRIPMLVFPETGMLINIGNNGAEPNKELAGLIKVLWGDARLSKLRNPGSHGTTPSDAGMPLSADEGMRLAEAEANSMAVDAFEASLPLDEAKLQHYLADSLAASGASENAGGAEMKGQRTRGMLARQYTLWATALAELGRCEKALKVMDALDRIFAHDDAMARNGHTWKEEIKSQKLAHLPEIYKKCKKYKEAVAQLELFIQYLLDTQTSAGDKGALIYEIYLREPQEIAQCYEADHNNAEAIRVYKEILDAFKDGGVREKSVRETGMGQQYDYMMTEIKNALAQLESRVPGGKP